MIPLIFAEFIAFICFVYARISGLTPNTTLLCVISILISALCFLSFRLPGWGYLMKFGAAAVLGYEVIPPVFSRICSLFQLENEMLMICIAMFVEVCIVTYLTSTSEHIGFLETQELPPGTTLDFYSSRLQIPGLSSGKKKKTGSGNTYADQYISSIFERKTVEQQAEIKKLSDQNFLYMNQTIFLQDKLSKKEEEISTLRSQLEHWKENATESEPHSFFQSCHTKEDLQKTFRRLSQIYHPDNACGDSELYILIQNEYEKRLERV